MHTPDKSFRKPTFRQFPELETETLRLQEIKPHHAAAIFKHFSSEAVTQYLDVTPMEDIKDANRLITFLAKRYRQERGIRWGISQKGIDHIIGTCGYNTWSKQKFQAELGYDLSAAYRRQGVASEAVKAVIDFGFTTMRLQKIEAVVLPENTPSRNFLKRLGFDRQGLAREFQVSTGQIAQMTVFSMEKQQWLRLSSFSFV